MEKRVLICLRTCEPTSVHTSTRLSHSFKVKGKSCTLLLGSPSYSSGLTGLVQLLLPTYNLAHILRIWLNFKTTSPPGLLKKAEKTGTAREVWMEAAFFPTRYVCRSILVTCQVVASYCIALLCVVFMMTFTFFLYYSGFRYTDSRSANRNFICAMTSYGVFVLSADFFLCDCFTWSSLTRYYLVCQVVAKTFLLRYKMLDCGLVV